ncbi:MAG: hypothetical protein KDJ19_07950 [Hyphomicrobiaceae bacterium]|nr:hypothetical protein [Hyphomicrobiaceae bacterium]MCC0024014.1 hypothetical protein [Hyphomicrobiaceae bacterium]
MTRQDRFTKLSMLRSGFDPTGLKLEIAGEMAGALGDQGRKAASAINALEVASDDERETHLDRAAYAVWAFFIQRELCGMRNHRDIIAELNVPDEVLRRMGSAATLKR